ncbi:SNF2 family protein, partial [gut metagenome]
EEYLASLAEDTNFENAIHEGWFSKIKAFFMKMLAKAGVKLNVELSDNELRYILWRSYENLAEPGRYRGVIEQATDVAKQYELGVGNYANSSFGQQHVAEDLLRDDKMIEAADDCLDEMRSLVSNLPNVHTLCSYDDIENLPYSKWIKWDLMDSLNNPECKGSHYRGSIFLFPTHANSKDDLRLTLWHEIAHFASYGLNLRSEYKVACLDYLDLKYPNVYDNIVINYNRSKWEEEAVAYLFEKTFEQYGIEKLFSSKFVGRETISTVFREIIKYLKDGTGEYNRFRQTPLGSKSASEIHKGSGTAERNDSNDSFDGRRNSGSQEVWSSKTQGTG